MSKKIVIKPIEKYPGYYVSKDGKVLEEIGAGEYSEVSRMMHLGKWKVKLKSEKKRWQLIPIQRLVAHYFLDSPPNGYYKINHKDGNLGNCDSSNLEYEDLSVAKYGDKNGRSTLTAANAESIRKAYAKGETTMKALAEKYGVAYYTIHCIIQGKTWQTEPAKAS